MIKTPAIGYPLILLAIKPWMIITFANLGTKLAFNYTLYFKKKKEKSIVILLPGEM